MAYQFIRFELDQGVAWIALNRPDVLNSMHLPMAREVQQALDAAARDENVRAVLLSAEGRAFCAGQDLGAVPLDGPMPDLAEIVHAQYNPIIRGLRTIPKPVVCAVNGVAAGAGANLALACDIVIAATDATFIQAFTRIGLIPDSGGTFTVPRLVGMARTTGLMMLGDKLTATQARDWGLIWDVVEPTALLSTARELTQRLATQPTRALGLLKQLLNASLGNDLGAQLDLEAKLQAEAGRTEDFLEGVRAFREKRKPSFRGR
ncbi:MAG TPA: enoyl-CoA hydratase-related protein [Gemmatimonadaceae bacterium]